LLEQSRDTRHQLLFVHCLVRDRSALQKFGGIVGRSKERTALRVAFAGNRSRLFVVMMPAEQRSAECAACISGGRLNPDFFERPFAKNASVPDTIERDTARKTKVALTGQGVGVA